jgi:hypothetical protein
VDLEQLAPERALVRVGPSILVLELEAEAGGDALDGFGEIQAFAGHHQLEGVAALLGAEAVPETRLRVDLE